MLKKPFRFGIAVAIFLCLGGCGLGNRVYSTTWSADLEQAPDMACAREAIAAIEQVWKVQQNDSAIGVFLRASGYSDAEMQKSIDKIEVETKIKIRPDITLHFVQAGGKPAFRMTYMGWVSATHDRAIVARVIITQVAASCHVPSLADRATERKESIPAPDVFNL